MASSDRVIRVYQELADYHHRRKEAPLRDRFLVLAADAALCAGRAEEAERLRGRLLQLNPHHLLKPYASLAEAAKSPDVQSYIAGLRRTYMPESAEHLLESLKAGRQGEPEPPDSAAEAPKVYRLQGAGEDQKIDPAAARPAVPARAGKPVPASTPAAGTRNAAPPPAKRARAMPQSPSQQPGSPVGRLPDAGKPGAPAGAWVATLLFLLTLAAGLILAFYIFARPFWPFQ